jgi:hypothetical protein
MRFILIMQYAQDEPHDLCCPVDYWLLQLAHAAVSDHQMMANLAARSQGN